MQKTPHKKQSNNMAYIIYVEVWENQWHCGWILSDSQDMAHNILLTSQV